MLTWTSPHHTWIAGAEQALVSTFSRAAPAGHDAPPPARRIRLGPQVTNPTPHAAVVSARRASQRMRPLPGARQSARGRRSPFYPTRPPGSSPYRHGATAATKSKNRPPPKDRGRDPISSSNEITADGRRMVREWLIEPFQIGERVGRRRDAPCFRSARYRAARSRLSSAVFMLISGKYPCDQFMARS